MDTTKKMRRYYGVDPGLSLPWVGPNKVASTTSVSLDVGPVWE